MNARLCSGSSWANDSSKAASTDRSCTRSSRSSLTSSESRVTISATDQDGRAASRAAVTRRASGRRPHVVASAAADCGSRSIRPGPASRLSKVNASVPLSPSSGRRSVAGIEARA
ncbi:hypothetical protein, partial [Streptomyces cinnamoneus]